MTCGALLRNGRSPARKCKLDGISLRSSKAEMPMPPMGAENSCKREQRTNLFGLCRVQPNLEKLKKHCVFFTGDKTMASVSLLCRLTLNSRLSIKKPAHKVRVSVGNERCEASQKRRYCEGDRQQKTGLIK